MWVRALFNHVEQVEHVEIFNAEYLTQSSREAEKRNRPLWVGATHREATKPSEASAEGMGNGELKARQADL